MKDILIAAGCITLAVGLYYWMVIAGDKPDPD